MAHTTSASYRLMPAESILNSRARFPHNDRKALRPVQRAGSGFSPRSIALRLLASLAIVLLAGVAQAQRPTAATHIVRPGETLGLIAEHYGVDIFSLAAANGISNAHRIFSWQRLTIPAGASAASAANIAQGRHIVRRGESLGGIATHYGIALGDLIALNNIFGWIYPGDELALPVPASAAAPDQTEARVAAASESATHIVQVGETLGTIAAAYGVSLNELQAANNIWTWIINVGQELEIPGGGIPVPETEAPAETTRIDDNSASIEAEAPGEASGIVHIVRFGESLGTIARDYGVTLYDLQALNDIWTWIIYVGQELDIPAGGTNPETADAPSESAIEPAPAAPTRDATASPKTHTVQRGETMFSIAKEYGVSLDALIRANRIADATKIHSGLVLRVRDLDRFVPPPTSSAPQPAPASQPSANIRRVQYTVQPGEFLSQIGAKFGMNWLAIRDINGISNPESLYVGAVLQIPTAAEAAKYGPVVSTNYSRFHSSSDHPGPKVGVGKEIVVVLSTQTAYAYENGQLLKRALISSGLPKTPTVQGNFKVRRKVRSQSMTGPDYDLDNVEWVMYFYQAYALHGTWWHYNFGAPMSHGCVNMTNADAKWFYDFAPIGTPVHVRFY